MKKREIRFRNSQSKYSILVGQNTLRALPFQIKKLCPKTKRIALIVDNNVPKKFNQILKDKLKRYDLKFLNFKASEKNKSLKSVNSYLNELQKLNFNRSDLLISVGGGIAGDVIGFVASIFKRGINFINVPTTLLAQVDSSIGGKTGVNSIYGKNLIGSFYQPKLVISDTAFLKSLPKKEIICGYAEILKHAIIKDKNFFIWLKKNTKKILSKNPIILAQAIIKSCQIKIYFVSKDTNEKGIRMQLNFGHTFAHAIEVKNKYSKNLSHGEAVLNGMILATRLSVYRKVCSVKSLNEIEKIYNDNNLSYTYKKSLHANFIKSLIPFLKNDKKNDDDKINFILLKKIGKTSMPNKYKISLDSLKKYSNSISQY